MGSVGPEPDGICEVLDLKATVSCPDCGGRGFVRGKWYRAENRCKRCDGYGRVSRKKVGPADQSTSNAG